MTISALLKTVCERLREQTGAIVSLGPPAGDSTGIFVWPWKTAEKFMPRDTLSHGVGRRPETTALVTHFLVVVHPAFSEKGLSLLETVRRSILDQPIIETDAGNAHLVAEELSAEELASLFLSAGLPVTACVSLQATVFGEGE